MKLDYLVKYSDRKTFGISVERDKSVVVRVPSDAEDDRVEDFVENKRFWIYTKLNHPQKYPKRQKKEFVSGTEIMYLGKNYRLDVADNGINDLVFNNKFIISRQHQAQAYDLFKKWYIAKAFEKIPARVNFYADSLGVEYGELKISELMYRWGSCTPKNNLNFNWKLVKAPIPVIDYVIVHELAHLIESNHTDKFWGIIKAQLPRYRQAKEWLRDNGHLLEVDF